MYNFPAINYRKKMGHKINPEIFRIGNSLDWKYQIRDPLLANISIYKTVKNLFMEYSAPYVSNTIRRKTNPRIVQKINIKKKPKNMIVPNPFLNRLSILFSHVNISYVKNIHVYIFLFEQLMERKRLKNGIAGKALYYLTAKNYLTNAKQDIILRKRIYKINKKLKGKKRRRIKKIYRWNTYKHIFKNIKRKYKRWKGRKNNVTIIKTGKKRFRSIRANKTSKMMGAWILNSSYIRKNHSLADLLVKEFAKVKILLRLFHVYKSMSSKKRIFFINILMNALVVIKPLVKNKQMKAKITLMQLVLNLLGSSFKYNFTKLYINKLTKQKRFHIFHIYSKILTLSLQKTCFVQNKDKTDIFFLGMTNRNISASLIVNTLIVQLGDYVNYKAILRDITKKVQKLPHIQGFRIILSGRLTRKERAAYIIKNHKSIPSSSYNVPIDYAAGFKIMKFGCVGIKVYLRPNKITTPPYWYNYHFQNTL